MGEKKWCRECGETQVDNTPECSECGGTLWCEGFNFHKFSVEFQVEPEKG